uniref:Uncharacterized protein n=1 Tax=Strix occidentalis caurina TaxID=311401 RepID=A0A8D0FRG5_STROC
WVKWALKKELFTRNPGWVSPPALACGVYPPLPFQGLHQNEQALAFSVMAVCLLAPAAWILAHVEHYKSRSD